MNILLACVLFLLFFEFTINSEMQKIITVLKFI